MAAVTRMARRMTSGGHVFLRQPATVRLESRGSRLRVRASGSTPAARCRQSAACSASRRRSQSQPPPPMRPRRRRRRRQRVRRAGHDHHVHLRLRRRRPGVAGSAAGRRACGPGGTGGDISRGVRAGGDAGAVHALVARARRRAVLPPVRHARPSGTGPAPRLPFLDTRTFRGTSLPPRPPASGPRRAAERGGEGVAGALSADRVRALITRVARSGPAPPSGRAPQGAAAPCSAGGAGRVCGGAEGSAARRSGTAACTRRRVTARTRAGESLEYWHAALLGSSPAPP